MKLFNFSKTTGGKKQRSRSIFFPALVGGLLLFLASTQFAHAGTLAAISCVANSGSCVYSIISEIAFGIGVVIAYVGGVCIGIAAWLVSTMLSINTTVFQTPLVTAGFRVTLAITNLGFVLGIIIIALATIVRNNTYGMKQILWKLVAAAILVNFSLVIIVPIFGFSNNVTQYFLNCTDPTTGCSAATSNGFATTGTFALKLAGAFNPQVGFAALNTSTIASIPAGSPIQGAFATVGANFSKMLLPILAVGFIVVESIMIVIVLFAIVIMLFVRYIYIAILAILMPFAWLCWVFPNLNSHWKKWWSEFIRWTIFAPVCVFFLYLAILTMGAMSSAGATGAAAFSTYTSSSNVFWGSAVSLFTSLFTPIIQNILNVIVMVGLSVAGLIVANSMGITGADIGMKAVGSVKNGITGYVSNKTKASARTLGRSVGDRFKASGKEYNSATRETTTRLQRIGSKLQNVPGLKGVGVSVANVGAPEAIKKSREKDVQDYVDTNLKSLTNEGIIARATSKTAFVNPTQAAALAQELAKRDLTTNPQIAPLMNRYVAAADRVGSLEKITNNRPDLMPLREKSPGVMETQEEATARAIKAAKGDVINVNSQIFNFANPAVAATRLGPHITPAMLQSAILSLSPAQLGTLGSDTSSGSQDRQNNITDAMKLLVNPLKVRNVTTGKFELDPALVTTAITANPELKNIEKMVKHMESSSNWGSVLGN